MTYLIATLAILVAVAIIATVLAVLLFPGVFDRLIGISIIGTKTTVLLAFVGVLFDQPSAFVDIALTYALLNFVVTLVVAKYFTQGAAAK